MYCKKCQLNIPNWIEIEGKKRRTAKTRKYCYDCSVYGARNTRDLTNPERYTNQTSPHIKEKNRKFTLECYHRRKLRKNALIDMKGGKCQHCGYAKCRSALTFHHRNPKEKSFPLSAEFIWKRKWEVVLLELAKCDLLCANCHLELHYPDKIPSAGLEPAATALKKPCSNQLSYEGVDGSTGSGLLRGTPLNSPSLP